MATASPNVQDANPGFVFETLLAYQRTAALRAAIDVNLFGALGAGPAGARYTRGALQRSPSVAPEFSATT